MQFFKNAKIKKDRKLNKIRAILFTLKLFLM